LGLYFDARTGRELLQKKTALLLFSTALTFTNLSLVMPFCDHDEEREHALSINFSFLAVLKKGFSRSLKKPLSS